MFKFIIILISFLFLSCKTTEIYSFIEDITPDNSANSIGTPINIYNLPFDFLFKVSLGNKIITNPKWYELNENHIHRNQLLSKPIYLIESYVNICSTVEILNSKQLESYIQSDKLTVLKNDSLEYFEQIIQYKQDSIRVISYTKAIENNKYIKFSCFSNKPYYTYLDEYSVSIFRTLVPNYSKKEKEKINTNITEYFSKKYSTEGNYLNALFNTEIFLSDNEKKEHKQFLNTYKSYTGNYIKAIDGITHDSINYTDAKSEISKLSAVNDILLFNENHTDPYGRYFLKNILPILKKNGYSALGLETLMPNDKNINRINSEGFPIHLSGFYSDEPQMANLIREAYKLNFKIFAYEAYSFRCDTCDTYLKKRQYRETMQAHNINNFISQNPKEKYVILAGHGHINNCIRNCKLKMMRMELERLTELKILSINQTHQDYYKHVSYDAIPKNIDNSYYLDSILIDRVDLQIIHKKDKAQEMITNIGNDSLFIYDTNYLKNHGGYLIIYSYSEESKYNNNTIPISVIKAVDKKQTIEIRLDKGKYKFAEYSNSGFPENLRIIYL